MNGGRRTDHGRIAGQALVESLAVAGILLLLYMAVSRLGKLQDMALQASNASRFAAFTLARNTSLRPLAQIRRHFFSGPAHQWTNPDGALMLGDRRQGVAISVSPVGPLAAAALPGGADALASDQRNGLGLNEAGILDARVSVPFVRQTAGRPKRLPDDSRPDAGAVHPLLMRHTAILTDAGHASGDRDAQHRVAASGPGWQDMADRSRSLGQRISSRMVPVDGAWERASPDFDWLAPWAGRIPERHLSNTAGMPRP